MGAVVLDLPGRSLVLHVEFGAHELLLDGRLVVPRDGSRLTLADAARIKRLLTVTGELPEGFRVVVGAHGSERASRLADVRGVLAAVNVDGRLLADQLIAMRP